MKQSKLNKLCNAFYDEFKNNNFLLAEYVDRRGEDVYFDIEFICYGIYRSKTPQAVETAKKVLKTFNLRGIYIVRIKGGYSMNNGLKIVPTKHFIEQ